MKPYSQSKAQILFNSQDYQRTLFYCLESAKSEVLLSTYIFEDDEITKALTKILETNSALKAFIILDGLGSNGFIKSENFKYLKNLAEVRIFNPLPDFLTGWLEKGPVRFKELLRSLLNINLRNHQKLLVLDGECALVGSRNMNRDSVLWRESTVLVTNKIDVKQLKEIFLRTWDLSTELGSKRKWLPQFRKKMKTYSQSIFSNHSLNLRLNLKKELLNRLGSSKELIQITTPYFFPTHNIRNILCQKAHSKVKVQLLLPEKTDVPLSQWIGRFHYKSLLKAGVEIYEFQPKVLHAKEMIVDEWLKIGSSNLNRRSLFRDLEVDFATTDPDLLEKVRNRFLLDIQNSKRVTDVNQLNWLQKVIVFFLIIVFPSWF